MSHTHDGHAIARTQVELAALVQEVLTELGGVDQRVTIRIGELPQVYADAGLLKQLFAILLSNAIKLAADTAEGVIEVGSYKAQDSCTVFVRDNGAGFDVKQAERLFRVSQRSHRHAKYEGAGVDLPLVKRIVESHGGRIWAKGKPGQGATFYFTLSTAAS